MPTEISARLASMLLLQKGELSRSDIAAFPWVEGEEEVDLIISLIVKTLDAEIQQRKVESSLIPEWEDMIVLLSEPRLANTK